MDANTFFKMLSICGIIVSTFMAANAAPYVEEFKRVNGKTQLEHYIMMNDSLPDMLKVPVGTSLELTCNIFSTPAPVSSWMHDGRIVPNSVMDVDQNSALIVNLVNKLYIETVKPHHAGEYFCTSYADDVEPVSSVQVQVIVEDNVEQDCNELSDDAPKAPVIAHYYKHLTQDCLQDVILPCGALGSGKLKVTHWTVNEQIIHSNLTSPRYQVLENGFLHIRKLRWADMGNYECFVESQYGSAQQITFVYPAGDLECYEKEEVKA